MVYANIMHTKRLLYYRTPSFPGLGRRTSYMESYMESYGQEKIPQYARRSCSSTSVASVYVLVNTVTSKRKAIMSNTLCQKCNRDLHSERV